MKSPQITKEEKKKEGYIESPDGMIKCGYSNQPDIKTMFYLIFSDDSNIIRIKDKGE